jgi:C4-dicarboxylate-specific signal transduction histidine kinase
MLYHSGVSRYDYDHDNRYILTFSDITEFEALKEKRINDTKLASIGKLAAGITHEINTPLAYMKGNLEMMRLDVEEIADATLKANLIETMETIGEGINRIATIVDTVREISKKSDTTKEKTNLYQTLIYALRIIYNRSKQIADIHINGKPFTMDLNRDEEVYEAVIAKQRIEQVWIIILNNALDELAKAQSFDERRIDIDIRESVHKIRVLITDNAGGIDAAILPKIFDPFVSTKTHQGMGIGLNIAKNILHEHKGMIEAENVEGGARFIVTLPKPAPHLNGVQP